MSNRIDFFQPQRTEPTLPPASISVFLDGRLCPYLEVLEIIRSDWPDFTRARLAYNRAAFPDSEQVAAEKIETILKTGKPVTIYQLYNDTAPTSSASGLPVFTGQIEAIQTTIDSSGEKIEILARDYSAKMERLTVYGQRVWKTADSSIFLQTADTIFNCDGTPNATASPIPISGTNRTVFCRDTTQAKLWNCTEIINYLLCEYLPDGELLTPDTKQLQAPTEDQIIRDLDVAGLSLLDALHHCCLATGIKFRFVNCSIAAETRQAIVFFRNTPEGTIELNRQYHGETLSISKTDSSKLFSRKNLWPVTHSYIGMVLTKFSKATFELIKAWDSNLEDEDYDLFSPSTNDNFYQVKDVYRKWCLNEAGDYTPAPYNRGDKFDFSRIFETTDYIPSRRYFLPALTTDTHGTSFGYFLEVSFDDGLHWHQYLYDFNNLLEECGVWLSGDKLDVDTWVAAQEDTLKFRITASVTSDEKLTGIISNGPVNSTAETIDHILPLARQFKYRKISSQSIFAFSSDDSLGQPDTVDDSAQLCEFLRKQALAAEETIENADVRIPYLALQYYPGDKVTCSPQSRDLLSSHSDRRSLSCVRKVQMDFRKQCTNLKIVRKRSY